MKNIIIIFFCMFMLMFQATAQNHADVKEIEVSGIVLDSNKDPLIGANIVVKNVLGLGVITNIDGKFKIKVELYQRLIVSYIGFESQEILIKDKKTLTVIMQESKSSVLDEVVITGTGEQKKITVTGAVSSANIAHLNVSPSGNLVNALAGNVPGVLSMQSSGAPGQNTSEFWIRGISTFGAKTSALVLVDGFERDMDDISIEDIESFQVLKDASETAIYGARGANGVVLITTKHGKPSKITISAKAETSYNTRTITPEFIDGPTYASLINEARITRNEEPVYQPDELYILKNGLDPDLLPNVDWMDEILKKGAMTYKASLNITGGSTNTRYFVSASYVEEEGMYKTDKEIEKQYNTNANARRWNYRMNADIDITKSTLLNVGISGMLKKVNDTGRGSSLVWNSLMGQTPVSIPKVYSNGYFPASEYNENYRDNPWIASTQTGYRQNWTNQIQTNVTLNQKLDFITEGLKFIGRFGYDTNNSNYINKLKAPERWKAERFRDSEGNLVFKRLNEEQKMTQSAGGSGDRHEFFEAELHYNRVFNKHHHVGSVLKYNQDSKIRTYNLGDDLKNSVPVRHQGFSGRFTYNWKYRYFVNFNFGYTGSENFAVGNQFGFFPAFSMAWNIAEEPFIQNNFKWLNMFKVRYSWGKVGNDNVSVRFPYMYTIGSFKNYQWADFGFNQSYNGLTYTSVASNGISWEIAKKHDIGLDLVLFNERFSLTVDYFNEKRTGIFMSRGSLPLTVGLYDGDKPYANVGSVINRGWDGNFSFNQNIGNVSLTIRANATYSDNEILEKDEGHKLYPYLYETGFSVSQSRGLIALGLFKDWDDIRNSPTQNTWGSVEPGDIKYKDVNGDGVINNNDRVAVGNTNRPSFVYGMGISANWKGLDASVHFQGTGKSSFFINGVLVHPFSRGTWGNVSTDVVNSSRWISRDISGDPATENPNAVYPRLKFGGENNVNNNQYSTHWLRNGSYLRLKTVEIGYTLPKNIVSKIRFSKIRLFFTGTNLLTFSKFKLWDPEPRSNDGSFYPITKSVTFGLNISL